MWISSQAVYDHIHVWGFADDRRRIRERRGGRGVQCGRYYQTDDCEESHLKLQCLRSFRKRSETGDVGKDREKTAKQAGSMAADCGFTHGDVAGVKLAEVAILIAGVTGPAQGKELPPPHLDATSTARDLSRVRPFPLQ